MKKVKLILRRGHDHDLLMIGRVVDYSLVGYISTKTNSNVMYRVIESVRSRMYDSGVLNIVPIKHEVNE